MNGRAREGELGWLENRGPQDKVWLQRNSKIGTAAEAGTATDKRARERYGGRTREG